MTTTKRILAGVSLVILSCSVQPAGARYDPTPTWEKFADGPWSAREGLMAVETPDGIVMTGGRTFFGARATRDVWLLPRESNWTNDGRGHGGVSSFAQPKTWQRLADAPYKIRAYHAMFYFKGCVFVMGGQTVSFLGNPFYNDVWKSCDNAKTWKFVTNAPWKTRAGIAFAEYKGRMIVAGGCYGSSIGSGRKFLNDVWASEDGERWELLTANASWSPRSGARLVEFAGKLLIIAGEVGFTPDTQLGDIWESSDGAEWRLVTATPAFSKRSGHGVVVASGKIFVVAGWHDNKCLHDLWTSSDAVDWRMLSNSTWGCEHDACGKFDFWPLAVADREGSFLLTLGGSASYSTFGKMWSDSWALRLPVHASKVLSDDAAEGAELDKKVEIVV